MIPKQLLAVILVAMCVACASTAEPVVLDVWPGKPPSEAGDIGPEKVLDDKPGQRKVKRITNVARPTISIFRPTKEKDTGTAVVICPGGGYSILAWDLEGEEVAEWLNSLGVTGIVLKYRVPRRPGLAVQPLQDAQRAMSLVRSKVKDLELDPQRIGMLGFSAGGHLTAASSCNFERRAYEAIDDIDKQSCRPDFAVLVYPAYLLSKDGKELADDTRVTKETPPTFLVHAGDDRLSAENSARYYIGLKQAGVPAELHIYSRGGHGFGLRPSDDPCSTWPQRCGEWLRVQGLLRKP